MVVVIAVHCQVFPVSELPDEQRGEQRGTEDEDDKQALVHGFPPYACLGRPTDDTGALAADIALRSIGRPSVGCRPVERDAAVPERDVGVVPDDEVVEQLDVEQAAGRQRLGGEVEVVRATASGRRTDGCGPGSRPPR